MPCLFPKMYKVELRACMNKFIDFFLIKRTMFSPLFKIPR